MPLRLMLVSLLAVGVSFSAHAAILVDDQFIDGGITNGGDTLDAAWSAITPPTPGSVSLISPFGGSNATNALHLGTTTTFSGALGTFTNGTALALGDSITLAFDLRLTSAPTANGAGLRFGFGSANNTYGFTYGEGGTVGAAFVQWSPALLSGNPNVIYAASSTPSSSINDQVSHSFSITLTRASSNTLSLSASVDGVAYTAITGGTVSSFTFNNILIGNGNVIQAFNLDNVVVSTAAAIPEPSTWAALAGGMGLVVAIYRRRRVF
ncbi:MAG: PEP-CTERM sorting domain-containing protein [Opitutaceae bacterium]